MSSPAAKVLYRIAAVIFEELRFVLPGPTANPLGNAPAAGAAVGFSGPFSGTLVLRITRDILPMISANMLGGEPAPNMRLEHAAVGELANVICGNVLPAMAGSDVTFQLDSPRLFEGPVPNDLAAVGALRADICMGLDSGKAELRLFVFGEGIQ